MLAAWAASPARFREDANAEEDASVGSPLVELAQNAADAALRAGVPGRLLVEVVDGVLYAANTGAPLDDAGVEALSHLRASSKGATSVGRYGIGFKAVLSVTDAPAIHSRTGGVRWSRAETREAVAAIPSLAAEAVRRDGAVPVMRLPFDAVPDAHAAALLEEWDTVVALPLVRDADLDVDPFLLMTLPLDALVVGGREYRRDPSWVVHTTSGTLPADLLADRPVEERERPGWTVTVALPAPEDRRLRAPQPTEERVDVPVFLSVSVPLEPSRKHVVPGPLTDWLAARAAEAYVELLESLPKTPDVLDVVPSTLPAGPFDLALREALLPLLPHARVMPGGRRGEETAVADLGPASGPVSEILGLLDPPWLRRRSALDQLGVRVVDTADVVDLLHGVEEQPSWWARMYEALANVPDRDALRALPVPLADGRVVTGPRGLLIPTDPAVVDVPGLRFVHPEACTGRAAEVLRGAGAEPAEPGAVLDALRDAVELSLDDEPPVDPEALAGAVLRILRASPTAAEGREWLGGLALLSADGDLRAADELLLPGAPITRWLRDDSPFGVAAESLLDHGPDALVAVGVVSRLTARDLEEIRPDAWPEALAEVGDDSLEWLRANVLLPATDGTLHPPHDLLAADADPILDGLYDRAAPLPPIAARLGLVTTVEAMDEDALADLADRIADRATAEQAHALYAALARRDVPLDPTHVRALLDGELVTVPANEAYAVDHPGLLPALAGKPWLPADVTLGRRLADVLGVRLASEAFAPAPMDRARHEAWVAGDWPSRHRLAARLRDEPLDEFWLDP